jgi:hypothetical protein
MMNPYMMKAERLIAEGKALLARRSLAMRAQVPEFSLLSRRRKLLEMEARYAEVARRFEELRAAGTEGIADLKVGLEKAMTAFESSIRS